MEAENTACVARVYPACSGDVLQLFSERRITAIEVVYCEIY